MDPRLHIHQGWTAGLIGEIVREHGQYYAREWGFSEYFEAKVAAELGEFIQRYDSARDLLLSAYADKVFLASVTVDGSDPLLPAHSAHLRWFIASDASRGRGIGRALLARAIDFVDASYAHCYLTTFHGLDAARTLYEQLGFRLIDEQRARSWGTEVTEQRFERIRPTPN